MMIIDAGAEDYVLSDNEVLVYTKISDLEKVKKELENSGLEIKEANLSWEPQTTMEISEEAREKAIKLLESIQDLDDVTDVYTNMN